jgi:hypothetical protein
MTAFGGTLGIAKFKLVSISQYWGQCTASRFQLSFKGFYTTWASQLSSGEPSLRQKSIRAHLRSEGFDFDASPEKLDKALLRAVPTEERSKLRFIWELLQGEARLNALYAFPRTLRQASLLFSHDRDRIEKSYEWLARVPVGLPDGAILDAGCGQGALTRYLAQSQPDRRIIGVDVQANLIEIAKTSSLSLANVDFVASRYEQWDIEAGSVALVVSAVGIDITWSSSARQNPNELRPDQPYMPPGLQDLVEKNAGPALGAWRRATRDGDCSLASCDCLIFQPCLHLFTPLPRLVGSSILRHQLS